MLVDLSDVTITTPGNTFALPDFAHVLPVLTAQPSIAVRHPTLEQLRAGLIAPLLHGAVQPDVGDVITASLAAPGSPEAAIAYRMLAYGYCAHYFTGEGDPLLPEEPVHVQYQQHTLVATCVVQGTPVVLGTLQVIVGSTLPALALFGPEPGAVSPHTTISAGNETHELIGELRRFSINPILDAGVLPAGDRLTSLLRDYRSLLYRGLYELSLQIFQGLHIHFVYGVATPEIHRFFTRGGMTMIPLKSMRLVLNDEVRTLQKEFARYWRSEAPLAQQPAIYRILLPAPGTASLAGCEDRRC